MGTVGISVYFPCCRPEMGSPLPIDDVPVCVTVGQVYNLGIAIGSSFSMSL